MPPEMKQKESLIGFKKTIRTWNHIIVRVDCAKICCRHRIYLRYDFLGLFNVFSETPYIEGSSHMETSELTCNANRLIGFYGVQIFRWEVFPIRL